MYESFKCEYLECMWVRVCSWDRVNGCIYMGEGGMVERGRWVGVEGEGGGRIGDRSKWGIG